MILATRQIATPVGKLRLVAGERGLVAILWPGDRPDRVRLGRLEEVDHPVLDAAARQIVDYFAGRLRRFDLPLDMVGTDFQKEVWAALLAIPFGQTRSYGALATGIGRPKACRAVGAANGRNPLSIVVPCHRAIGTSGALTGFAGGLETKRFLLALESAQTSLGPTSEHVEEMPVDRHAGDERMVMVMRD